jgi:DNA repair protein SbcD/Mre11
MKILHTSDWHLNERLGRIDRNEDLEARLHEIAGYLEQHDVDVMVVAGDLFTKTVRIEPVRSAVNIINRVFSPFLLRGGTIIAISGNHDSEELFNLFREFSNLVSPLEGDSKTPKPNGRMYLYEGPGYMRLKDKNGQVVQFYLLPYPKPHRYLTGDLSHFTNLAVKNRALRNALKETLDSIQADYGDPALPAVMVSHINIRTSKVNNLYHLSEDEDVIFEIGDLPSGWAYIACGHIHKSQPVEGFEHVCYAGSIDRMDFGEMDDEKGVWLVDVLGGVARQPLPKKLLLNATPLYRVVIQDPTTELAGLASRYPDPQRAIVEYEITYTPGKSNLADDIAMIEQTFPRWCWQKKITTNEATSNGSTAKLTANSSDVPLTIRTYLEHEFENNPDRDDLLALAEKMLANQEDVE